MELNCRLFIGLLTVGAVGLSGCGRSSDSGDYGPPTATAPASNEFSQVHWRGAQQLSGDPQATNFVALWQLPESTRLTAQTLDKLARAPGRWLGLAEAANAGAVALLRPLLDDLVAHETHLTLHHPSNRLAAWQLAVRVPDARAPFWQSNLAAVAEALFGSKVTPTAADTGWTLAAGSQTTGHGPRTLQLSRTNGWTLLTASQTTHHASRITNYSSLLYELGTRSAELGTATNWLTTDLDLAWLLPALGVQWTPPPGWPRLALQTFGEGENVRTRGECVFARSLEIELPPWNVPTNRIYDPLTAFTGMRGLPAWLGATPLWPALSPKPAPKQLFFWSLGGLPQLSFFAAPHPDGAMIVDQVAGQFERAGNAWLETNAMGNVKPDPEAGGLVWADCAFLEARLRSSAETGGNFLVGGLFPDAPTPNAFPPELLAALASPADLVLYDWEMTGDRMESLLYVGQLSRMIFNRAQLPADAAGIPWLKAIAPRLGNCVTLLTRSGPDRLSLSRQGTAGFTAFELHLLVDWLESQDFPAGFHTTRNAADPDRP